MKRITKMTLFVLPMASLAGLAIFAMPWRGFAIACESVASRGGCCDKKD
jgi:hypothetical protein